MKRFVIPLIMLVLLITGCKANFTDEVSKIKVLKIALPETEHYYGATWITKNIIMVIKDLDREDFDHDYLVDPKSTVIMNELYSYDINKQDWAKIPLTPENCHSGDISPLERLPNGKVGLAYSCRNDNKALIREFDISMKNAKILFDNDVIPNQMIRSIGTYAFSPDMKELVQEYPLDGLKNKLYFIVQGKKPQQIVPDFVRAKVPAWSPHNREIAFWGVPDYYGDKNPTRDYTWQGLLFSPSNLYLSTPEGNHIHALLSSIEDPAGIAWSPTKNIIAFVGKFTGVEGLWLIDPVTLEVTRIWDKRVRFSWSPDGKKIVISSADYDSGKFKNASINIIQLP